MNLLTLNANYIGGFGEAIESQFDEAVWNLFEQQGEKLSIKFNDAYFSIKRNRRGYMVMYSTPQLGGSCEHTSHEDIYDFMLNNIIINQWDFR